MVIQLAKTPVLNLFIRYFTPKGFIEKNLKEVYYDQSLIEQATIDRYYDLTLYDKNRQAFIDRAYIEREDYTERLKEIKSPALILWGEEDTWITVGDAKKFKAALPQAVVRIMPKRTFPWKNAQRKVGDCLGFFERLKFDFHFNVPA